AAALSFLAFPPDIARKLQDAVAHHRRGEIDPAIALYTEILNAEPGHTQTLQLLGQARLRRRDIEAAEDCFQRILALEPANLRAREWLGEAQHRRGDLDAAARSYAACLTGHDGDRAIEDKLASVAFAREHLRTRPGFRLRAELLEYALRQAPADGLMLELGVASGVTLRFLASLTSGPVYGFDSFAGLPADWQPSYPAGSFAQARLPSDLPPNAHLVVGLFADTLPAFAAAHPEPIRFLHVDCDLYASTKIVFDTLGDRLVPGGVIVFDEYLIYPGWREHEYRAFQEFTARTGRNFEYVGWIPGGMQVAVKVG
ncbi:MAG: class I SAM-dependent methyltransferase, partial [Alphaproteobacteria bacterium]|nr:class I SAM-dependent methyltransferase [Alphaproteobacteria bacterium]